ncbi:type II toxin-antitoxin system RelB family antitoxin [Secundilactobacillus kimchicus]|uniref:type II toxin-antitoxin system RelB family antitoxin n=1 Tax=Secundilactobacillus kimchicus TaxID=528209 RepID=UPI0024A8F372|nr:DUF6290 family protein [Secundilactobacillus kimchicus]
MAISVRLKADDEMFLRDYAKSKNMSLSELLRSSAIERAEDELDRKIYDEAMADYESDPTTYSTDEVKKRLGL